MKWYIDEKGNTKTHSRPHRCSQCRTGLNTACPLPFRKTKRVRLIRKFDTKPMFFSSLVFNFNVIRPRLHL